LVDPERERSVCVIVGEINLLQLNAVLLWFFPSKAEAATASAAPLNQLRCGLARNALHIGRALCNETCRCASAAWLELVGLFQVVFIG
jgi:hypothetical protein